MSELDTAKLRRLRSAVRATLDQAGASVNGLAPTYNALREEAVISVPPGLREELKRLAPTIDTTSRTQMGRGPRSVLDERADSASAVLHLAALDGWLDAVIERK